MQFSHQQEEGDMDPSEWDRIKKRHFSLWFANQLICKMRKIHANVNTAKRHQNGSNCLRSAWSLQSEVLFQKLFQILVLNDG